MATSSGQDTAGLVLLGAGGLLALLLLGANRPTQTAKQAGDFRPASTRLPDTGQYVGPWANASCGGCGGTLRLLNEPQ